VQSVWDILVSTLPSIKTHFSIVLVFTVVEYLRPAERKQPVTRHVTSAGYNILYFILTPFAMILPSALAIAATRRFSPGLITLNFDGITDGIGALSWPARNILLPLLPILLTDFFYYWHHRLQHRVPALWTTHRLHHTAESLNALASYRVHWLEEPLRIPTMVIPMGILFNITPVQGAWIAFALAQMGLLIHANIRVPYGPLTPVFTGPQLHRLHHSIQPEHHDKNYAANFPIWDILFGTYVAPKRAEWPKTGLPDGDRPRSVFYEIGYPFIALGRRALGTRER
jgi:sterol desaturase/sphingolipid hydroxylase (fatty acid hydroxylase superfamily)